MIDVTEILQDPDFADNYTVIRTECQWIDGRFETKDVMYMEYFYPVHPATEKELEQVPEGDRTKETKVFFCVSPKKLYITQTNNNVSDEGYISDKINYNGKEYKIVKIKDWNSHGWSKGFGVLIGEAKND